MPKNKNKKYRAFISYCHADARIVKWLHQALETFRLPRRLIGQTSPSGEVIPERVQPIFRDRDELASAAHLSSAVIEALAQSAALIVVCSRKAALSGWVNQEILEFKRLGGESEIYCVIVDGIPGSSYEDECFPPALVQGGVEPLAADLRSGGDGRRGTCRKLIAGILGISLDDLVMRDQRRRLRQMLFVTSGALISTIFMTSLAVNAYFSKQEAERSRNQAEELIGFMLGELRQKLEPIGKLEVLDSVANKAMDYFASVGIDQMTDDIRMKRSIALRQIGEVRMFEGNLEESLKAFSESLVLARELASNKPDDTEIHFELGQIQFWTGYLHWQKKEYKPAETLFNEYLDTANYLIRIDGPDPKWRTEKAYAYLNLGSLFSRQKLHASAQENFNSAILQFEALSAEFPDNREYQTELANCYSWMGGELRESGDVIAAIEVFERHLKMLEDLQGDGTNKVLAALLAEGTHFLADLYLMTADLDSAEEVILRGKQLYVELTGIDPENMRWQRGYAMSLLFEARMRRARNNLPLATRAIEHAKKIIRDVAERTDIESYRIDDVAIIGNDYAQIMLANNRFDVAETALREIIDLLHGTDSYELARAYLTLGTIIEHRSELTTAAEMWTESKKMVVKLRNTSNQLNLTALLAELFMHTGEQDKAMRLVADLQRLGYKGGVIDLANKL